MTDLVQRLRVKWQHREGAAATKIAQLIRESVEAADEIERLRARVVVPDGFDRGWNEGIENIAQMADHTDTLTSRDIRKFKMT